MNKRMMKKYGRPFCRYEDAPSELYRLKLMEQKVKYATSNLEEMYDVAYADYASVGESRSGGMAQGIALALYLLTGKIPENFFTDKEDAEYCIDAIKRDEYF